MRCNKKKLKSNEKQTNQADENQHIYQLVKKGFWYLEVHKGYTWALQLFLLNYGRIAFTGQKTNSIW